MSQFGAPDSQTATHLVEIADRRARRERANYGYDDAFDRDVRDILIKPGVHNFRFEEMPGLIGDPNYFATQRRVLDVGCGTAPFVFGALCAGMDAYGIDIDFEKIAMAQLKPGAFGYPPQWSERAMFASAFEMPFSDDTFDIVTSFQVLEHLERLPAALYEAVRVTKRGGWLIFRAPDYRMSFEPHYRLPWPQFAPPRLAERWVLAMGRPAGGLDSFYYITLPQVSVMLQALGCRLHVARLDAVVQGRYVPVAQPFAPERIIVKDDRSIADWTHRIKSEIAAGTLPEVCRLELNFVIAAQRT